MKIAYIILAHNSPEQLARLIYKLNTDYVSFFIHIDKKTDSQIYSQIYSKFNKFANVFFVKRYNSEWGSFNAVRASLEGIKSIVETGTYFDYVIHLSGQDYLIKSTSEICKFLQENKGKEFIEYFPLPYSKWKKGGFRRIEYWHIRWKDEYFCIPEEREFKSPISSLLYSLLILILPKRKLPEGFTFYGGSAFWCLTGECVKYINDFVKQNPKFVNRFNYTSLADELFYQIVILNSPFKDKVVNDNMRYIDWGDEVEAYHPKVLDKNDFEKISESEKLFARKFDQNKDSDILNMIDEMILLNK
ncbi:beta-1,6-N-acetylglucosaminyltransferase [Nostoc sp. PA-18-2419]|uniref:beta-1,6-N-acetylglucosaminyltransferase n=1 Tax=Nostoc sp. PA-18-2419 TaxID=2575443 RepID=UPI0011081DC9|nr:beta-1,6-N-acetylglucosaminyltransferase [Nostoc sp. PA-18-2419]